MKKRYKVELKVNGELRIRQIFSSRTKAQKYILSKYNAYSNDDRFYVRFVHYSNWGKYKKPYHDMTIDSMHIETISETNSLNICIELSPV